MPVNTVHNNGGNGNIVTTVKSVKHNVRSTTRSSRRVVRTGNGSDWH